MFLFLFVDSLLLLLASVTYENGILMRSVLATLIGKIDVYSDAQHDFRAIEGSISEIGKSFQL